MRKNLSMGSEEGQYARNTEMTREHRDDEGLLGWVRWVKPMRVSWQGPTNAVTREQNHNTSTWAEERQYHHLSPSILIDRVLCP